MVVIRLDSERVGTRVNTYEDESEEEAGHKDPKEGEYRDDWGKSGILAGKTVKPR